MGIVQRTTEFLKEVRVESAKVTWPSRKALRESTVVVIVAVTFIGVFTGAVDRILSMFLGFIIR
ncbi:MAG: preprotein translocase subunit SecE [Candidatus Eisenbacteria bacterium]|nr:preprotein translocase subunit SecE [Candidatus Eisenbacteria bacterium]